MSEAERSIPIILPREFTLVYTLFSFDRNAFLRIKVALKSEYPTAPSITKLWANASWYEREVYDMFGIRFEGHPHLAQNIDAPHLGRSSLAKGTSCPGY